MQATFIMGFSLQLSPMGSGW